MSKNPQPEIGWFKVSLSSEGRANPLFKNVPEVFPVIQWHYYTFDLPPQAKLLASSALCRNQAMHIAPAAYGLQFHVEVTPALIRSWLKDAPPPQDADFIGEYNKQRRTVIKTANQIYENFFH